ncbi:MAG TPA: M14 family zinc carboxypeptidase, partial [Gemmatimonadaceae bacterium]|nr:M14 family zinc carboxypeptidase [Gemmatimonadaceae bacterium]
MPSTVPTSHPESMRSLAVRTVLVCLLAIPSLGVAQRRAATPRITSPREQFGHDIGDDYFLVNYGQMIDYWRKIDRESDRMRMVRIGTTAEGRPMWMAIVTAPENQRKLAHYQEISRKLALAEDLS